MTLHTFFSVNNAGNKEETGVQAAKTTERWAGKAGWCTGLVNLRSGATKTNEKLS